MSLSPMEKSLCNKLVDDYWKLVQPVKDARLAIRKAISDLDTLLRSMTFSPLGDLANALNDFKNDVEEMIPGDTVDELDRLKNFLEQCPYLSGLAPATSLKGTLNGIFDNIQGLIDNFTSLFPEFGAGNLASYINGLLNGLAFPGGDILTELLKQAEALLQCLSSLCALQDPSYLGEITDINDDLQSLYSDLNLVDTVPVDDPSFATFDYDTMYHMVGLTPDQISAINDTKGTIDDQKANAADSVQKSIDAVKQYTKNFG